MRTAAVIVAAGRGLRTAAEAGLPKQYVRVGGLTILQHTLARFLRHPLIDVVLVVIHPDDSERFNACAAWAEHLEGRRARLLSPVHGATTRQGSVRNGLEALLQHQPDAVLVHDAARPFVSPELLDRVIAEIEAGAAGALPALAVADTLKRADAAGVVTDTVDRSGLWRAQTPQAFRYSEICAAHRVALTEGRDDFTDDAAVAQWAGLEVRIIAGSETNTKITTAEDLAMAERILGVGASSPALLEPRTGTGFDVHRFTEGDHVWLCGVRIPHEQRLDGHSDADVGLHALTDAILGALADGDIGDHFPPSDMRWKGAASDQFLRFAAERVASRGGRITNVDVTLLCEAPRIGPHRDAMRERIATILNLDASRVGVKATTTEQLGFTGRREGIAAMASATILLPA